MWYLRWNLTQYQDIQNTLRYLSWRQLIFDDVTKTLMIDYLDFNNFWTKRAQLILFVLSFSKKENMYIFRLIFQIFKLKLTKGLNGVIDSR